MITRPPFTLPNPGTRNMQVRGAGLVLDWLAGFPGGTAVVVPGRWPPSISRCRIHVRTASG